MTEKKLAANVRNGVLSHGAATEAGRARVGAAQLSHGMYSKAPSVALPALGEDPEEFESLLEDLRQEFAPPSAVKEKLIKRLARTLWMMERCDHTQDGDTLRRAKDADRGRENRLHARMMRLKITQERLRRLARSVSAYHYVTPPEDLEAMKHLHQDGVMGDMGEIALALFFELQAPDTDENGVSELNKARRVVEQVKAIFGIGMTEPEPDSTLAVAPIPAESQVSAPPDAPAEDDDGQYCENDKRYPQITQEDGEARERARKLLRNILSRQAEQCDAERKELLQESIAGPWREERAAEVAPPHQDVLLVRRAQESHLRQLRRITDMLFRIQDRERLTGGTEDDEKSEPTQNVAHPAG